MNPRDKLNKIKEILDVDGPSDAYDNLSGAMFNLEQYNVPDRVIMETLTRVRTQIHRVVKTIEQPETHHDDDWHHTQVEAKEH